MYGMVNEGIHKFTVANLGPAAWETICGHAGLEQTTFERMASYDDKITYDLVGAVCLHTGLTTDQALEQFGTFWVTFAKGSPFGNLLRLAGRSFIERLYGLDDMHDRILVSMPHLAPPSFELELLGANLYHLHYYSKREGLAPMVVGLLHGLAADSGESVRVRQIIHKSDTADHDVFEISLVG